MDTKFVSDVTPSSSSALIVVHNENGLNQEDMDRAENIRNWILSSEAPKAISGITSVFDSDALRASLISQDDTTMLMTVNFSVPALDETAKQAIVELRERINNEAGTNMYVTGSTGLLFDLFDSIQRTIDRTTLVTVLLVILLLLIVYRSPVASLVPLIAIGMSFLVARSLVSFLAQAGVGISTITDAYLVVTIFGVGTDYCLFIVSRFREESTRTDRKERIQYTMRRISPVIMASAATVVIAFLCLGISRFEMTRTSGWSLSIGIMVTLIAGLTLVPALMSIFGGNLFWPAKRFEISKPKETSWNKIGQWVANHPAIVTPPIIILLLLPYIAIPEMKLSSNVLSQLPESVESAQGLNVIREHFPSGEMEPVILLIESPEEQLTTTGSIKSVENAAQSLKNIQSVKQVDYVSAPSSQLTDLGVKVKTLGNRIDEASNLSDLSGLVVLKLIPDNLQSLAISYPGILQSSSFSQSVANLQEISPLASQLTTATPGELIKILPELKDLIFDLSDALTSLGREFLLEGDGPFVQWLKVKYFSADGKIEMINLIPSVDSYSDEASQLVTRVRDAAPGIISSVGLKDSSTYVGGEAAISLDMLETNNSDFIRVLVITSLGILVVIILLLRSLLAPLYMVITVLFNYGATLGISTWLFLDILKDKNLVYLLPVFVFVMLAAVGADYNIFLMSRIREEYEHNSNREAVQKAVAHTGGVITSCGIILAGTFATLATSSLPTVLQIGVPIAIGVIIDTFLVRALLVPALAALLGRWSWWPSALFRKKG
jgi:RND superfamily putative drug exporter